MSAAHETTFGSLAREWWEKFLAPDGAPKYAAQVWRGLERDALPALGNLPLPGIDPPLILSVLRKVEARGTIATAHKLQSHISQVLRYGIACGLTLSNPARDLGGALSPKRSKQRAAIIEPGPAGRLMRDIDNHPRKRIRCALRLAALTFLRPGKLRRAEWAEIDMAEAQWRIPAERMKMRRPHIVPLARQAMEIVRELSDVTGSGRYLFPSLTDAGKPMSGQVVNRALRRLGYAGDVMTGHGFRAMASSLLAEQGWGVEAIERQLAHVERNQVRAAYHRSGHLEERRRMMQAWADYLDMLYERAVLGREKPCMVRAVSGAQGAYRA